MLAFILAGLLLISCDTGSNNNNDNDNNDDKKKQDDDAKKNSFVFEPETHSYTIGNEDSDTVLLVAQGGPTLNLITDTPNNPAFTQIFNMVDLDNITLANIHQAQTLNPEKFNQGPITFEEAKAYAQETVDILESAVRHYKAAGKTVYVIGISFGAFVVQDLLLRSSEADGHLIVIGRLNMPDVVWQTFSEGKGIGFDPTGTTPLVDDIEESSDDAIANASKLAAGLGYKRYTTLLTDVDLSSVVYLYAERDEAVGHLTAEEVTFLNNKDVTVIAQSGSHTEVMLNYLDSGLSVLDSQLIK